MKATGTFVYGSDMDTKASFTLPSKSMQLVEAIFLACLRERASFHFVIVDEKEAGSKRSVVMIGPDTPYMFRYEGRDIVEQYTDIDKLTEYTLRKRELEVRYSDDIEGGCYIVLNTHRIEI